MDSRAALSRFALTLAGIDPAKEREEHFFDPIGRDQLCQFFLLCPPPELEELDPEDALGLLVAEITSQTGLNFSLATEQPIASLVQEGAHGRVQVVLDLSNSRLVEAHLLGEQRDLNQLSSQLSKTQIWLPTRFGNRLMAQFTNRFTPLSEVQLSFEQSAKLFNQPQGFKAQLKGVQAPQLLDQLLTQHPALIELAVLAGPLEGDWASMVWIENRGLLRGNGLKIERFLSLAQTLRQDLEGRYQYLEDHYVIKQEDAEGWSRLQGAPLYYPFGQPLDQPQALLRQLTGLHRQLGLAGHVQRATTRSWRLDLASPFGGALALELDKNGLQVSIKDRRSIGLLDRLETFLSGQVSAGPGFYQPETP
ncbi:MAG: hypothetical protein A2508_08775 [Candidatus Lambdaproteobacteria bacterium RIFOXYD12_FULL_49_8]|uniref:Uncharacterized protein n=1 Tax=Candidatus Lambdaproteobacteria bacterium RIFOXYD2_FULL_50_16 TaxID=1817772 RepID=A0A1F6GAG2_9PROT|nr:MAG: hypothetical protein A2527_07960 [Candidatus Lambdaproteobacteria bacterium RIFOXYD2_FULL_50_16]OGG98024.1 MAG: hypothetical protein A2508_08775 [Candidatus Lambdaproteobacteria bacterium RIFOXYD12_FULL_49_8]